MTLVLHVISGLKVGGAELALYRLLTHWPKGDYRHEVVCLTPGGELLGDFRQLGLQPVELDFRRRPIRSMAALVALMRRKNPAIVQTWMYHADLLGGLAARLAGIREVFWGIRCTDTPAGLYGGRAVVRMCAWLSAWVPERIICCAEAARTFHADIGYRQDKLLVIPNGYVLEQFTGDALAGARARQRLGLRAGERVVGLVGRFDRQKDHEGFVRAAGLLAARMTGVRFLMIGRDVDSANGALMAWIRATGCADRFVLTGQRSDMPDCYAAMDVLCSSSCGGEGFPNVVCEAMASGRPCVVTDVGDAALIVGDTGTVVAPGDPSALADALLAMLALEPAACAALGSRARARVQAYSMPSMVGRFASLYRRANEADQA